MTSPRRLWYYLASIPTLLAGVRNLPAVCRALLRRPPRAPFVVRLRDGGRFAVTSALDVWLLKEVCLDREYERAGVAVRPGDVVVDVGAGLGEFCVSVARAHPDCRILAVEPLPAALSLLRHNIALNGVRNVTVLESAVTGRPGTVALHAERTARPLSSTVRAADGTAVITVTATSLAELLSRLDAPRVDLLKLDCEGAEYDILLGADASTLARVGSIALEYHDGVTAFASADLAAFLRGHGFAVRTVASPAHPRSLGHLYATSAGRPATGSPALSVVIPVHDEAAVVGGVVEAWAAELERLGIDYELLVYDDGSRDDTPRVLDGVAARRRRVRVRRHANRGHGPTILRGYRQARGAWVFQVDSDDEMGPEAFEALWRRRDDFDLLLGVRDGRAAAPVRRLVTRGARLAVRALFGRGVSDANTPYRLVRGAALVTLLERMPDGAFAPNVIMSACAVREGLRIHEHPVTFRARRAGTGSLLGFTIWRAAARALVQLAAVALRRGAGRR